VVLERLVGLLFIACGVYLVATVNRNAEKWEREGHEPGRITLFRPERPRALEIRIRGTAIGLFVIVTGVLGLLGVFH
jgi:uncharacterized membrane protein YfcA